MRLVLTAVRYLSGFGFMQDGLQMVHEGLRQQRARAYEQRPSKATAALSEQIFEESLARGDPPHMASFERTRTLELDDWDDFIAQLDVPIGVSLILVGLILFALWVYETLTHL